MNYEAASRDTSFNYEQRPVLMNRVLELPGVNLISFLVALSYIAIYGYMNEL